VSYGHGEFWIGGMTLLPAEEWVRQVPLLAGLPEAALSRLAASVRSVNAPAGTVLYREGDQGDCLSLILQGQVEILSAAGTPDERVLAVRGRGDFLGELSLLGADRRRTASVRCRTPISLLELDKAQFDALVEEHPALGMALVRELILRFRASESATIQDLQARNRELAQAYVRLQAAQAQLVAQEKLEHELQVARTIQESLLPEQLAVPPGWHLDAFWRPAHAVSGDFYDSIPLPDGRLGLVVGDVTGSGVPAALVMATTLSIIRAVAAACPGPGALLASVNGVLVRNMARAMFVTCQYAELDPATGRLRLANAGHPLPCRLTGGSTKEVRARGLPLGLLPDQDYEERELTLDVGDCLLLCTDGLLEARTEGGELFGTERASRALASVPVGARVIDQVLKRLAEFTGPAWEPADDLTLVTVQRLAS
jgi:serine phosphatase RsbU (regulator of sigma subunit)